VRTKNHIAVKIPWIATVVLTAVLTGCQSVSPGWRNSVRDSIDENLSEAKTQATGQVPAAVSQALLPPIEIALPEGGVVTTEPRFDLTVSNAHARQVFMGLVEGTPYSMVVHPDIDGTISLNLKGVTVPESLKSIRAVYGYEYRRDGDRFFILGRGMQTRLFPINYLNLIRKGKSDTRVRSGEIGQRTSSGGSGSSTGSNSSGSGGAGAESTALSGIHVKTESQTDFWKDLGETLKVLIGNEAGRKVVVNPQAGAIVVRAMPEELRVVEDYLKLTHDTVNRQVVLEAKILEVELNDGFQTGINWAKLSSHGSRDYTIGQVGGGTSIDSGLSETAGNAGNLDPTTGIFTPISGTDSSAFGGVFSIAVMSRNFSAFIELLKSQGEVQVLSSPRVSTVNNQKAVIKIGGDEFFVTGVSSTSSTVSGTGTTPLVPTVELSSFFSGIVLDVTPQIDEASNIILHVHPAVSTISQRNKKFSVFGEDFDLPLALSTIQESDNIVRAQSGQVIVIGGLMKEGSTDQNSSVPLLGDIPLLGNLFKHKKVTRVKKELVILLKPTVINLGQEWGDIVDQTQERIKKIRIGS
jgi:MSHA biogenesis protein MshL